MKILLIIFFSSSIWACQFTKWPHKTNLSEVQIKTLIKTEKQDELQKYLYHEITTTNKSVIAKHLLDYMIEKSSSEDYKKFYKAVEWGYNDPKREKIVPKESVCELHNKFQEYLKKKNSTSQ